MPTRASIIRPFVERFLITNGIASLPNQIETVSDAFGRAFVRASDAIWIISAGVVASDVDDGTIAILPIDTSETKGGWAYHARRCGTDTGPVHPDADHSRGGHRRRLQTLSRMPGIRGFTSPAGNRDCGPDRLVT